MGHHPSKGLFIILVVSCGILTGVTSAPAWGDIYSFKDENGVVHISNVPVDTRYRFKQKEKKPPPSRPLYENQRRRYDKMIEKVAADKGLDPDLLRAVIEVESAYDHKAVSVKGAAGLMQLMPGTAKSLGVKDLFHPGQNMEAGARHLKLLIKRYKGELPLALAAYNAGTEAVDLYQGIPPFPETQKYVPRVLNRMNAFKKK